MSKEQEQLREELVEFYQRIKNALDNEGTQVIIDELASRARDVEIAITDEIFKPLGRDNEIASTVKSNIIKLHIQRDVYLDLIAFFNKSNLENEIKALQTEPETVDY